MLFVDVAESDEGTLENTWSATHQGLGLWTRMDMYFGNNISAPFAA